MIVVVETNFILELALQQEHAEQAETILKKAEGKQIHLAIPAYSFPEAHLNLAERSKKRSALHRQLRDEIQQMARSGPFAELGKTSEGITNALVSSATVHAGEFWKTTDRLRACAEVIPLGAAVTEDVSLLELLYGLQTGDLYVFASVHRFLKETRSPRSLFVTKDKDFLETAEYLAAVGGETVVGFPAALAKITQAVGEK